MSSAIGWCAAGGVDGYRMICLEGALCEEIGRVGRGSTGGDGFFLFAEHFGGQGCKPLNALMNEAWSILEVSRVGDRSRLTACLSAAPLKILSPGAEADYGTAVLSSYGGGLVAGDCARLRVRCGRGAKLFLGTQAFTKVYKTTDGQIARQEIEGRVGRGGCAIVLPDPVVPYADSAFEQEQVWRLDEGALLVLLDGGTAGRTARGEYFQYGSYTSNITVYLENEPVLVERFSSRPGQQAPARVGVFGGFAAFANAFAIGSPESAPFVAVQEILCAELERRLRRQLATGGRWCMARIVGIMVWLPAFDREP